MEKKKNNSNVTKLAQSGALLALGLLLPVVTGQVPRIGNLLLPMHIPVLLCGFICGPEYGLLVGLICPLLRSAMFGMPPMFPTAVAMAAELATYGLVSGFLYSRSRWQCIAAVEKCLIAAMIAGRVVWGLMMSLLMSLTGKSFTIQAFLAGAFLNASPGIVIQLIFIPVCMLALHRAGLVPFRMEAGESKKTA